MAYRAVDGVRRFTDGQLAFAHLAHHTTPQALSEQQPLITADEAFVLVTDAFLVNRAALIATLRPTGFLPAQADDDLSDASLILAAYRQWGEACLAHLDGDYVFAVWDKSAQVLVCGRSPFGGKALHLVYTPHYAAFSSDVTPLLTLPGISRQPNALMLAAFGTFQLDEESSESYFRDILWLPRSGIMRLTDSGVEQRWGWQPEMPHSVQRKSAHDYAAELRGLLTEVMIDQMRSSRPIYGISLSGGMDSTTIAALVYHQLTTQGEGKLIAHHIYAESMLDERPRVRALAQKLGITVQYHPIEPFAASFEELEALILPEIPFLNLFQPMSLFLAGEIKAEGGSFLWTGHGGDNLFARSHYTHLYQALRGDFRSFRPLQGIAKAQGESALRLFARYYVRPLLPKWALQGREVAFNARKFTQLEWLSPRFKEQDGLEAYWERQQKRWRGISPYQDAYNRVWYGLQGRGSVLAAQQTLAREGVESRMPLLDRRLVNFSLTLPLEEAHLFGRQKLVMRRAMSDLLPPEVTGHFGKRHVNASSDHTFYGMIELVRGLFHQSRLAELTLVDDQTIQGLLDRYITERRHPDQLLLTWLMFMERWLRKFC
ncbi:MAG TPA: asparagine synthase-related protein [Aggregatilineales bacterium]|nr:asparagine synthase-related protein [Aggregatilineales bacterium]